MAAEPVPMGILSFLAACKNLSRPLIKASCGNKLFDIFSIFQLINFFTCDDSKYLFPKILASAS
jgi:hypothetical protein